YYWGEFGQEYLVRERYGAGVCYDRGPVVLRGEWIGGRTGTPGVDGGPTGEFRSSGWYALGGWRFDSRWSVVARYDTLLGDTRNAASRQTNYTAGLTWQPLKWLRGQLNYTYEDYKISAANNRNVASLMVTAMF
ncbi:MAG: OprO/OprP family phosphate-selective porin, partial [Alistipes sp.]|nr:OprO/OprP family phosphate-selective porin [Alistipes sp.]